MPASEWNISSNRSEEQLQSDEEFRQREWESTHPTYTFQVGQTVKYNRETCTVFKVMPELIMVEGRSNRPIRIEAKDFHLVKVIGK